MEYFYIIHMFATIVDFKYIFILHNYIVILDFVIKL